MLDETLIRDNIELVITQLILRCFFYKPNFKMLIRVYSKFVIGFCQLALNLVLVQISRTSTLDSTKWD